MQDRRSLTPLVDMVTGGLAVPRSVKTGALVIAVGLLGDLVVHTIVPHAHEALHPGFPIDEHLAHLVVVIGMAVVLAGIVADGIRSKRRLVRQEGTTRHAIR